MTARRAVAAALLLLAGPVARAEGGSAEVAAWLAGTFEAKDADGAAVRIVVVSVPKSRIANGSLVLYREQAVLPKTDEPKLQRFYRLEEEGDLVRLHPFDPKDPLIVRGKWRDPSALALYGSNDMREKPGCAIVLRKSGSRWEGATADGAPCPSVARTAVRTATSLTLEKDALVEWDRGFDEKGKQTWGPREGGTAFVKVSASSPVDGSLQERTGGRREEKASGRDEEEERDFSKRKAAAAPAPPTTPATPMALSVLSPSSPSRGYDLSMLRGMAGNAALAISRLFSDREVSASSVVVVTSRSGAVSVFSSAEIFSFSSEAPALDLSSNAPRLAASGARGLEDVVSIELRVLAPSR